MTRKMRAEIVKVRLTDEEVTKLKALAKAEGVSKAEVLRMGLEAAGRERRRNLAQALLLQQAQAEQDTLRGRRPPTEKFRLK